ncbi:protein S100-A4-like [Chelydra serpentina]|uniref:Protein S100 n=2 Tax=Chelydra serpentina TaxID=8475 RepID=A0A8C3S3Q6_CHESE|nr:protein S100-A4-like [Chelydra serpentina]
MARPLERALDTMVSTFHKYAGKEGDKYKLNKAELKDLVMKELPSYISKQTDEASFQRLMNNLDSNRDKEVDFQEYATFLACVAMMCNEDFEDCPDKMPRKM